MKRFVPVFLALVLTIPAASWAAPASSWLANTRIHVSSGMAVPKGPQAFSDYWRTGVGLGAGLETPFAKHASLCLDLDYTYCGLDRDRFMAEARSQAAGFGASRLDGLTVNGGDATFLTAVAGLKLELPTAGSFAPYVKLGVGVGHVSITEVDLSFLYRGFVGGGSTPSESENRFTTSVGAGVRRQIKGSRAGYDLEARWVSIATEGEATQMIPVRLGFFFGF